MFGISVSAVASGYRRVVSLVAHKKECKPTAHKKEDKKRSAEQQPNSLSPKAKNLQALIRLKLKNQELSPSNTPCIKCGESCKSISLNGTSAQYCESCKLFHFPSGTLKQITGFSKDIPLENEAPQKLSLKCNSCSSEMLNCLFSRNPHLMLPKCSTCGTVVIKKEFLKYIFPFL